MNVGGHSTDQAESASQFVDRGAINNFEHVRFNKRPVSPWPERGIGTSTKNLDADIGEVLERTKQAQLPT